MEQLDKLFEWLSGAEKNLTKNSSDFQLDLDGLELCLSRRSEGFLCIAYLGCKVGDQACVEKALRVGAYSIGSYEAGVAVNPSNQELCLIRLIDGGSEKERVVAILEELANQTDVWKQLIGTSGNSAGSNDLAEKSRKASSIQVSKDTRFTEKGGRQGPRKELRL